MATQSDPYESLLAEYTAAMAKERAEWKALRDSNSELAAVERVKSYARWRAAAEDIKALSIRMRDVGVKVISPPQGESD
jgi:hypothetical protein